MTAIFIIGCFKQQNINNSKIFQYDILEKKIIVDGDASDWFGVNKIVVEGADHLWLGQDMILEKWHGNEDLSYSWRSTWFGNKLYFLFEIDDNNFQKPKQEYSWLNDCVEIQLDPRNLGGSRIEGVDKNTSLNDRFGKKQRGYELHFLPSFPPRVYLKDTVSIYYSNEPQNDMFTEKWSGEIKVRKTDFGYMMEFGFSVPDLKLKPGFIMGIETAVGDDDGDGRKSLMIWTGKQVDFWINMDNYGKVKLIQN